MELLNKQFDKLHPDKEESAILAVNLDSPANRCLEKMEEHNIFCFPVMNPEHGDRVVGLLDRVDVCAFALQIWDDLGGDPEKFDAVFKSSLEGKTASAVMNFSKMNDCYTLGEHATFKDVLKVLSRTGVRRVPMLARGGLFDRKSKRPLARFITQTDVIRFVATNLDLFEDVLDVPIAGKVGTFPAHCVSFSSKTIDAFREMLDRRVSALGVVNEEHALVGNISIRDIGRLLTSGHAADTLKGTVQEFLEEHKAAGPRAPISCQLGDTVRHAITTLNSHGVHRVYLVGEGDRPAGLVTLSDLCRFLLTLPATVHKKENFSFFKQKHTSEKEKTEEEHASKKDLKHLEHLVEKALESEKTEEEHASKKDLKHLEHLVEKALESEGVNPETQAKEVKGDGQ